jgi:hypothetical protein
MSWSITECGRCVTVFFSRKPTIQTMKALRMVGEVFSHRLVKREIPYRSPHLLDGTTAVVVDWFCGRCGKDLGVIKDDDGARRKL